jgi:hypothetical protein
LGLEKPMKKYDIKTGMDALQVDVKVLIEKESRASRHWSKNTSTWSLLSSR